MIKGKIKQIIQANKGWRVLKFEVDAKGGFSLYTQDIVCWALVKTKHGKKVIGVVRGIIETDGMVLVEEYDDDYRFLSYLSPDDDLEAGDWLDDVEINYKLEREDKISKSLREKYPESSEVNIETYSAMIDWGNHTFESAFKEFDPAKEYRVVVKDLQ